jgi:hypothetical protein
MSDTFQVRLRAAAGAAWWVAIMWWALQLVSAGAVLLILHTQPAFVLNLIGGEMTWPQLTSIYMWFIGLFKLMAICMTFTAAFLSIWSARLRRLAKVGQ